MKSLALLLLLITLPLSAQTNPDDLALCALFEYVSGRPAAFDGEPYGFPDMPADLAPLMRLPVNDPVTHALDEEQAYWLFYSPSTGQIWVYLLWSLEPNADATGEHYGVHKFCDLPKVVELEPYGG